MHHEEEEEEEVVMWSWSHAGEHTTNIYHDSCAIYNSQRLLTLNKYKHHMKSMGGGGQSLLSLINRKVRLSKELVVLCMWTYTLGLVSNSGV